MIKNNATNKQTSLRSKVGRKMTLQACLIAIVAILSICFTSVVLEQFLVREALKRETHHFWLNYELDNSFPAPNTDNLKGYLTPITSEEGMPEELKGYPLGFQKIDGQTAHSLLYNSERHDVALHLFLMGEVFSVWLYYLVFFL